MPEGNVFLPRMGHSSDCLSAAAATGAGTALRVSEDNVVSFQIGTDGGGDAALTVLFQMSNQNVEPDWDSAQSVTNHWTYINTIDMFDGDPKTGAEGFVVASADGFKDYEVNVGGMKWVNAIVTARTEGEVTVKITPFKAM